MYQSAPKEIAFSHFKILKVLDQHHKADPQMGVSKIALYDDLCDYITETELTACLRFLSEQGAIAAHAVGGKGAHRLVYYSASPMTHCILDAVKLRATEVIGGKRGGLTKASVEAYRACEECGQLEFVTRKTICGQRLYLCRGCLCKDVVVPEPSRGLGPGALMLEC